LCPEEINTLKLQKKAKLTLRPKRKEYSPYVTFYAISTLMTNLTNDYVPSAHVNVECCFENLKDIKLEQLTQHVTLVNITSSKDDLRIASMKVEEIQPTG
jgi:hypothetical protein